MKTHAIVLAVGKSTRMGDRKLAMRVRGERVFYRAQAPLIASTCIEGVGLGVQPGFIRPDGPVAFGVVAIRLLCDNREVRWRRSILEHQKRLFRLALCFLLLLCFAQPATALNSETSILNYTHEQWTTGDGLPQSSPQVIVQDDSGYLWLGTQEGLARFDGIRFRVFNRRSKPALPANNVTALFKCPDRGILIGMRGGGVIKIFPDGRMERPPQERDTDAFLVRSLLQDRQGRIWIGTRGNGLIRLENWNSSLIKVLPEFSEKRILALLESSDGKIWIGTEGHGVAIVGEDDRVRWLEPSGDNTIWALCEDHEGFVWAGSFGDGLIRYSSDGTRKSVVGEAEGLSSNRVLSVAEDRQANLWVGTSRGLNRIRNNRVTGDSRNSPLDDEVILSILEDREGSLWIGGQRSGLHRLGDSLFSVWDRVGDTPAPMARVLYEGRNHTIWLGTSGQGLLRVDPGTTSPVFVPGFEGKDIFALYEDPRGALWVGSYEEGLFRLADGRLDSWTTSDGLPVDTIWAIEGDGENGIWIGTYGGGLVHFGDGVEGIISTESGLSSNLVRCLHRDRTGILWAGLSSGGVVTIDGNVVSRPVGTERLATNSVLDIHENSDGSFWIATAESGLCYLRDGTMGCVDYDQGLFDDKVYRILSDSKGNLWMSSNRGIFRVLGEEARQCALGALSKVSCTVLGPPEGMPTAECNGGSQPCGIQDHFGRLWFPTLEGFVSFDPTTTAKAPPDLPAIIEAVRLGDQDLLASSREIRIPSGSPPLEIDYTLLYLKNSGCLEFQYKLRGLHENWLGAGRRRTVYFDHLPPGHFKFLVRGGVDGRWGPPSSPLEIEVQPSLTQRPLFQFSLLFLGILLIIMIAGTRIRSHKIRARELEAKIAEATHDLRRTGRELEKANQRLEELAQTDPLTGVANRRYFDETLSIEWERCRREGWCLSLLMIDIDHFKAFNDSQGHQAGDEALRAVAFAMSERIRRATDHIARYGGEEFSVVLSNTSPEVGERIAWELRQAIMDLAIKHPTSQISPVITISIGVASIIPSKDSEASMLIRMADQALYKAKAGGRNQVVVDVSRTDPSLS